MPASFRTALPASPSSTSLASNPFDDDKRLPHLEPRGPSRYSPLGYNDAAGRLADLRREMEDAKVEAYIVPTADAHGSEYVGDCDRRRAWLSGFTGSAGVAIVTRSPDRALLFTDSRYFTQATQELDPSLWSLQKVGEKGVLNWPAWLVKQGNLEPGARVGVDGSVIDYSTAQALSKSLEQAGLSLIFPEKGNLVDRVWGESRPARSAEPIRDHPLKFAGKSASDKLSDLRSFLSSTYPSVEGSPTPSFLLTTLPSLAWALNLRGSDIAFNPVFYSFVLVRPAPEGADAGVVLWVQGGGVTQEVRRRVEGELGGEVREYEEAVRDLREIAAGGERVVGDGRVSWEIAQALGSNFLPLSLPNPIDTAQAIKNPVEIEGFRRAYLRDGLAWVRWIATLEHDLVVRKKSVTEWEAAERLTRVRERGEGFEGLAYENISATGENAALPHYEPTPDHPFPISLDTPYLNDSGAQYLDGTIDTTRTYHFSPLLSRASFPRSLLPRALSELLPSRRLPKDLETHRRAFTRVLQGHIAIDRLVFPEGTTGEQVDVLARTGLWREGWDYGHGTGHGVGEYLSVHETQIGISHSEKYFNTPFTPGHITSNEPAFYRPGSDGGFGIRTESVVCVKEVKPAHQQKEEGGRKWYGFERLTVVPIQSSFVDPSLLTHDERKWLKEHNKRCRENLWPFLNGGDEVDRRARRWLERQ
ncbi:hypothetical protein JCM8547_008450 [Rhodosporidiobolus lusitaniae]